MNPGGETLRQRHRVSKGVERIVGGIERHKDVLEGENRLVTGCVRGCRHVVR